MEMIYVTQRGIHLYPDSWLDDFALREAGLHPPLTEAEVEETTLPNGVVLCITWES